MSDATNTIEVMADNGIMEQNLGKLAENEVKEVNGIRR